MSLRLKTAEYLLLIVVRTGFEPVGAVSTSVFFVSVYQFRHLTKLVERHLFLDYPLRLHYLSIRGFTEPKAVRTGFEPTIGSNICSLIAVDLLIFRIRCLPLYYSVYQSRHLTIFFNSSQKLYLPKFLRLLHYIDFDYKDLYYRKVS